MPSYKLGVSDLSTLFFFFFNDTATTEIYTLSLHDALPICGGAPTVLLASYGVWFAPAADGANQTRSEEHTSELQSRQYLVCRLLLEKKKNISTNHTLTTRCTFDKS